jgi:hypothetical protein
MKQLRLCRLLFCLGIGWLSLPSQSQEPEFDRDDVDVSYIYAAVMGTGSYKIGGRRITMLRAPFSWTQREMSEGQTGFKWTLPVTVGNDSVGGSGILEKLFPDNLVTLTLMPGFEYQIPVTRDWSLKPFVQAGVTHDFVTDEVVLLGVVGLSSVARFDLDEEEDWEIRWGNKIRFAAEHQLKSGFQTSFGILETGLDIRRDTGFIIYRREVDIGGYYRYQHFVPDWDISDAPDRRHQVDNVHELGVSVGLAKPKKIFGITFSRVRLGYKKGGEIQGFTIGGEFPF